MARPSERKIRGETAIAQTLQFLGVEFTGRFEEANSTLSRPFVVKKIRDTSKKIIPLAGDSNASPTSNLAWKFWAAFTLQEENLGLAFRLPSSPSKNDL